MRDDDPENKKSNIYVYVQVNLFSETGILTRSDQTLRQYEK